MLHCWSKKNFFHLPFKHQKFFLKKMHLRDKKRFKLTQQKNCTSDFFQSSHSKIYGPLTLQDYYADLEKKEVQANNKRCFENHQIFRKKNKEWTLEMLHAFFGKKIAKAWDQVLEKRLYLTVARLQLRLKYPYSKSASLTTIESQLEKRYKALKKIDLDYQEFFRALRELRDQYIFIWFYRSVIQKLINVFFGIYVYTVVCPVTIAVMKSYLIVLANYVTIWFPYWKPFFIFFSLVPCYFGLVIVSRFLFNVFIEMKNQPFSFQMFFIGYCLTYLAILLTIGWFLFNKPIIFFGIQYLLYSFQLPENEN